MSDTLPSDTLPSDILPPGLKILKIIVIVMTVMILIGLLVLGAVITDRLSGDSTQASLQTELIAAHIGSVSVALPPQVQIQETIVTDTRLALRTIGPDGEQIFLFHLPSGTALGNLTFVRP